MSQSTAGSRRVELSYHGGLDGLRGLAVIGVVLYHGGVAWATGGFLGVEIFFVLSGFLITSLLLAEWRRSGTIALGAFWGRRARRLLPALLAMVSVVGLYYAIAGPDEAVPGLKSDGLSTLLYAGNWHQISAGSSYFAATGPVSPLTHTWSLAIEEQFYVFWPLLLMGILWLVARRPRNDQARRRSLHVLLLLSVLGALASIVDTALLINGGKGLDRVYYGTDTRAASLLFGATLAMLLALRGQRRAAPEGVSPATNAGEELPPSAVSAASRRNRLILRVGALAAFATLLLTMKLSNGNSTWLYPYGLIGLDLAVTLVIAAIVLSPASPVSRLLSARPLRGVGKISYGVYLWHFPLFLWLDESSTGLHGTELLLLRLLVTLGVSLVSYVVIEQPIRHRMVPHGLVRALAPVAAGCALASLLLGSALSTVSFSEASAASLPKPPAHLAGSDAPCQVKLTDGGSYGLSPIPLAKATKTMYATLGSRKVAWKSSSTVTFHTCPPNKVLVVGDSLAFSLGIGMMENEQRYGLEIANAGILGCAFTTTGQLDLSGTWAPQSAGCSTALAQWSKDADALGPQAVVVELGYRDTFNWKLGGKLQHLGQPAFAAAVRAQIDRYIKVLGAHGRQVVFLSIPWTKPPANADGSPAPAADPARHAAINQMLRNEAKGHGNVHIFDLDKVVSPSGHYQASVNGQLCRFDGVHFSLYCSRLVQPHVLTGVRALLDH